jgi:hypothetical protein
VRRSSLQQRSERKTACSRIHNIFNKIITENFPNLEKVLPIQSQKASRTPNRLDQNKTSPWCITMKTTSIENKEY